MMFPYIVPCSVFPVPVPGLQLPEGIFFIWKRDILALNKLFLVTFHHQSHIVHNLIAKISRKSTFIDRIKAELVLSCKKSNFESQ